jgi:hypothetical protein
VPPFTALRRRLLLMQEHGNRPVLKIAKIMGESFAHLQPLGIAMRDLVTLDRRQLSIAGSL